MTDLPRGVEAAGAADRVEARVRERIAPTPDFLANVARVSSELVRRVEESAKERSSPLVRALVAGSAARGTFLSDRLDIDLFLLFPPDLSRDRLREEGLALGRAVLSSPETRYAEHPYLRGEFDGFRVDAVPGFAITDPSHPLSPVDRTPFHQSYLTGRETPEIVDQVRLAKQFFRTLGVYGSEAKTEGFSGYLVELLVLQFGSLRGLLHAARSWRLPVRLAEPGKEPPRLPPDVALILADPVDPHRNVASALSRRNLALVIVAASAYLTAPTGAWFEPRPRTPLSRAEALARLTDRTSHVSVVHLPRPDLVDDTLYPQVRKAERAIAEEISRSDFVVLGSSSVVGPDQVLVLLEVAHSHRSAVRLQDGPPPGLDRVGHFLEKWTSPEAPVLQGPYVRPDGSLGVETRRAERDVEAVIRSVLPRLALGKDLTPSDPGRVAVMPLAGSPESPALGDALRELLGKRLPWLDTD
ncbi:MAG: CCA tRNA nucleotidyltransferase [Thermoplasmata archaeon]